MVVAAATAEQAKRLPKLNCVQIKDGSATRRVERRGLPEGGADLCVGYDSLDDCVAGTEATAVAVVRMSAAAGTEAVAGQTAAAMAVAAGTAATVSWRRWRSGDECAR